MPDQATAQGAGNVTAQPAAAAPTAPEPVSAPAVAAAPPAKPAPKLKGKAAHEAIRASLAAKKAEAAPSTPITDGKPQPIGDKPSDTTQPKPTEPEKPKPAVGAVMRLTAENTKLTNELSELRTKYESASKAETIDSLREKVKKDPAVLLDLFGADLSDDENERLTKLNDAVLARLDPASAADRETRSEVEALKKQLAERDAETKRLAAEERNRRAREHTARVLTDGFKDDIGETIVDGSKYPYVNHLTREGVVDVHAGISATVRDLVGEYVKAQKRNPTDAEVAKMIAISAEQAEAHFAGQARKWQLPTAQPAADPPPARVTPETIGSQLGGRDPGGVDTSRLTPRQKHELIRQRLREGRRQGAPN